MILSLLCKGHVSKFRQMRKSTFLSAFLKPSWKTLANSLYLFFLWHFFPARWKMNLKVEAGSSTLDYEVILRMKPFMLLLFSHSVMSDSLRPHGLQHARLPCPSPSPRACSNSCPLSRWCPPTIFSSVVPFSSCLQSFPASGSFPVSEFFTLCGQMLELQLQHQLF